jgi:Fibronectin type III domain
MPTISQLPSSDQVTAADKIPVSQAGATHAVTVGTLLASTQPAVISASGTLLGRISTGPGGPESIAVGLGLLLNGGTVAASGSDHATYPAQTDLTPTDQVVLNSAGNPKLLTLSLLRGLFSAGANITISSSGTIAADVVAGSASGQGGSYSITSLPPVTSMAASDLVAISQAGTDHTISYANLLDGLTIDLAQPAATAADTDALWVAQGSNTMLRQTFAAVWSWLTAKLPSYRLPVVEVTKDTSLDATIHNGRILVCSQPVTLTPLLPNLGNGFFCDVINLSSASVTFGAGVIASSGSSTLPAGQAAALRGIDYSGGNIVFALVASAASSGTGVNPPALPGQVTGLGAGSQTTSSIVLTWSAPSTGGAVSSYTVQYRVSGATAWTIFATGVAATSETVTGLAAGTSYDFQISAINAAGSGQASTVASASTASASGAVTSVTWNMVPSGSYTHGAGSIGVNAHVNPANVPVQFGFSTSSATPPANWTIATYVNADLWGAYVSTPATAGTWYAWVEGTDGSRQTVYPVAFTVA